MQNIIGIDIGGTKIAGVVFNGKRVLQELTIATPNTFNGFKRNLYKLVDFLSVNRKISGIGVGCAGLVNSATGMVRLTSSVKFKAQFNMVAFFKAKFHLPVKVDNDASCFTRAELILGQGEKFQNFLGVILGSGLGGGIVINRQLYRGKNNSGGEIGHIVVNKLFLQKFYQIARDRNNYSRLSEVLGQAFASFANIFAPDALILGGGVSLNAHAKFLPQTQNVMRKFLFDKFSAPKILVSKLKNAGALGAALLFKESKS